MESLANDLACFSMPEVTDEEIGSTSYENGIVFVRHESRCFSALGLAPGAHFGTQGVSSVAAFGVPATWQVIALADICTPDNPSTIQHEMLHALGVLHEHQRPDRDTYLLFDPSASSNPSAYDLIASEQWFDMGSPLEVESVMTYCSLCGAIGDAPVMTIRATGETFSDGYRITTTDAKQLQHAYCELDPINFPDFTYKQTISCTSTDKLGFNREIFTDRLCDNVVDCGGGEDETGELNQCNPKVPNTSNGCCGSLNFPYQGECIANGEVYNNREVWECSDAVIANYNGVWYVFTADSWPLNGAYWFSDSIVSDAVCPPINEAWNNGNIATCVWAGADDSDECDPNPCDPNATCTDLYRDYSCECNELYTGDGETCTFIPEVDECADGTHMCDANAICTDARIDYTCECADGFKDSHQVFDYIFKWLCI